MRPDATTVPLAFERPRIAPGRVAEIARQDAAVLARLRELADARRSLRDYLADPEADILFGWRELARLSCTMSRLRAMLRANRIEVDRSDLGVDA